MLPFSVFTSWKDHIMFRNFITVGIGLLVLIQPVRAQTATPAAPPSAAAVEANKLFQSQKWSEAVVAYEALTKAEPTNGIAWYRWGLSLNNLNKPKEAVPVLEKAVEFLRGPQAMYLLGSTYAKLNEKDKAFESLSQAATVGFAQLVRLQNDPSLSNLRDDARYVKLVEDVRRTAYPCLASEKAKQLNFWVGEWELQINGQSVGTS